MAIYSLNSVRELQIFAISTTGICCVVLIRSAAAAAKSRQSCPTLCDPIDGRPPGSAIPGILQERTLEWVAISFSNAWKWKGKVKLLSHVRFLATPWTVAYQAPPSMEEIIPFSRQEYWSGLPLPSLIRYADGCISSISRKLIALDCFHNTPSRSHFTYVFIVFPSL